MDACDRRFPARRKLCRSQPLGADGPRCHCLAACKRVDAPGGRLFQLSLADAERALPPVQGRGRYDGGECGAAPRTAGRCRGGGRVDRKSTRLNSVTNAPLVCRLLTDTTKKITYTIIPITIQITT